MAGGRNQVARGNEVRRHVLVLEVRVQEADLKLSSLQGASPGSARQISDEVSGKVFPPRPLGSCPHQSSYSQTS